MLYNSISHAILYTTTEISEQFPDGARVAFDVLKNNKLLTSVRLENENKDEPEFQREPNSRVISATVGTQQINGLQNPVRITFNPLQVRNLAFLSLFQLSIKKNTSRSPDR